MRGEWLRFPHNVRCKLGVAHADKGELSEDAVIGPLREANLAHELRANPRALGHLGSGQRLAPTAGTGAWEIDEWTSYRLELQRESLRDRPGLQHPGDAEAKIVVKP